MLTKDTKLRFWCQKVLPLVYDDSLSYYELLNKVVLHLNKHTEDINALIDFYNTFTEDIEEIIRQMMEDGDFNEIIADTIGSLIAAEYDPDESYIPLNYVIKDGKIYCCTDNTTGEWDSTKWRETTVGDELNTLMQRAFTVNAGQVAYSGSATYPNDTVGKKLQTLTANDVAYNSSTTYNDGTVGKELKDLNSKGKNPLAGKRVGFWGDSLMYGLLQNGNRSESNYPKVFGDLTGATVENNAYSGASITNYDEHSFINIYQSINWNNYDIAVLGYGANDVGHGETIANITSAFETVTSYMMNSNPNLIIALCSPSYSSNLTGRYQPSNICLRDVYYIVRNVAKGRRIKFIDFLFGASINEYNINTLSWDGLHFTDAGYYKLGEYLASNLLGETIHDVIDFGNHAQKLQVQHFGGNAGCNLYIYGDDNTIYSITFYTNAMALVKSDDGGTTWTTLWTLYPSP